MTERRVFALLGHPVSHSLSPTIHAAAFAALGLPHVYTALDTPSYAELVDAFEALRSGAIWGANVTLPHQRAALELADIVHESAAEPGAANVLVRDSSGRITAWNTDADALAEELAALLPSPARRRAMVIGAGGAALAAVVACRKLGFKVIATTSRSWTSSQATEDAPSAARMRALGALALPWPMSDDPPPESRSSAFLRLQWTDLARGASLVVQATSTGMVGVDSGESVVDLVPWMDLVDDTLAYDVVYTPRVTPFLRAATKRGLRAEGGLGMLVRQAARSIELWLGVRPPLDVMARAAEDALDRGGHTV